MTGDHATSGETAPGPATGGRREVSILLGGVSPPAGEVGSPGVGGRPFVGWLDLLRVLAELFAEDGAERPDGAS